MTEPTLADVPGILLRTILRTIARVILLLASVGLMVTLALFLCSLFLGTWRSSRNQWQAAASDAIAAVVKLVQALR